MTALTPLPCPFCGAEMVETLSYWGHPDVECFHQYVAIRGDADIALWNRRAAGRASRETVERMAEVLYLAPPRPAANAMRWAQAVTRAALAAASIEIEEAGDA